MRASKSRVGISIKSRIRGCVPVLFYAKFISHDSHLASVSEKGCASSKTTQNNPKPRKHQNKQMQVDQVEIVPTPKQYLSLTFSSTFSCIESSLDSDPMKSSIHLRVRQPGLRVRWWHLDLLGVKVREIFSIQTTEHAYR
jgi:hypothetical protein